MNPSHAAAAWVSIGQRPLTPTPRLSWTAMPSISSLLSRILPCFKHSPSTTTAHPSGSLAEGPATLAERIVPWRTQNSSADCAASARVQMLNRRTATPVATQELLHAMCLHLALRAKPGPGTSPDFSPAIAQAVSAMTQHDRRVLKRHLEDRKGWLAWARSQLSREGQNPIARKQEVAVETQVERLLASVRKALDSPPPRQQPRGCASATRIGEAEHVHQVLLKAAAEIRTSGHWSGLGADLAPHLITSMPAWPQDLSLRIEDKAGKWHPLEFGRSGLDRVPVTVQLDHVRQHYSPIVDGQPRDVPAKGDCFYESVLRAMRVEDQRALFKGMHFQKGEKGAGMAALIRAMRRQVAEELERQIHLPGGPSDELRAHVAAAR
ncbi:hypothetical protein [Mitsuaria sp. CC2]|uniref:hypothetical protein n=1 Tax=Mitsuaria sp. CC2 TaxID=3029186 RepID=UPI003B9E956E